jgi:hypothetical protein
VQKWHFSFAVFGNENNLLAFTVTKVDIVKTYSINLAMQISIGTQ